MSRGAGARGSAGGVAGRGAPVALAVGAAVHLGNGREHGGCEAEDGRQSDVLCPPPRLVELQFINP
jgi:hypothetical protein